MNKKIKIVFISFFILMIPGGYFAYVSYAEVLHGKANDLVFQGMNSDEKIDEACKLLDRAIRLRPSEEKYHLAKVRFLQLKEDFQGAIEACREYSKYAEYKDDVWVTMGVVYEMMHKMDSALQCYRRALPYLHESLKNQDRKTNGYFASALVSCALGDYLTARDYAQRYSEMEGVSIKASHSLSSYIKNYKGKGLNGFYNPEKIDLVFLFESPSLDTDSLLHSLGYYFGKNTRTVNDSLITYYTVSEWLVEELEPYGFVPEDYFEKQQQ